MQSHALAVVPLDQRLIFAKKWPLAWAQRVRVRCLFRTDIRANYAVGTGVRCRVRATGTFREVVIRVGCLNRKVKWFAGRG